MCWWLLNPKSDLPTGVELQSAKEYQRLLAYDEASCFRQIVIETEPLELLQLCWG
jgi:hypothetical protein